MPKLHSEVVAKYKVGARTIDVQLCWQGKEPIEETCGYCQGNCPNEPDDSEYLCDGFAGDIDGLYALDS